MQIDKLFDELDARALDEVLTLPVRGTAEVSARRIRRRVNRTLDADPAARRTHRMQLCRRAVCAALIAACLITGAFAAAAKFNLLRGWLDEDRIGALAVNTERQTVETNDLRLTLEESLSDDTTTYIAYSITALSDTGRSMLQTAAETPGSIVSAAFSTESDALVTICTGSRTGATQFRTDGGSVFTESLESDAADPPAVPLLYHRRRHGQPAPDRRRNAARCAAHGACADGGYPVRPVCRAAAAQRDNRAPVFAAPDQPGLCARRAAA